MTFGRRTDSSDANSAPAEKAESALRHAIQALAKSPSGPGVGEGSSGISRDHVALTVEGGVVKVQNVSRTNPIRVAAYSGDQQAVLTPRYEEWAPPGAGALGVSAIGNENHRSGAALGAESRPARNSLELPAVDQEKSKKAIDFLEVLTKDGEATPGEVAAAIIAVGGSIDIPAYRQKVLDRLSSWDQGFAEEYSDAYRVAAEEERVVVMLYGFRESLQQREETRSDPATGTGGLRVYSSTLKRAKTPEEVGNLLNKMPTLQNGSPKLGTAREIQVYLDALESIGGTVRSRKVGEKGVLDVVKEFDAADIKQAIAEIPGILKQVHEGNRLEVLLGPNWLTGRIQDILPGSVRIPSRILDPLLRVLSDDPSLESADFGPSKAARELLAELEGNTQEINSVSDAIDTEVRSVTGLPKNTIFSVPRKDENGRFVGYSIDQTDYPGVDIDAIKRAQNLSSRVFQAWSNAVNSAGYSGQDAQNHAGLSREAYTGLPPNLEILARDMEVLNRTTIRLQEEANRLGYKILPPTSA